MNIADQFMMALTAWRENRGGGEEGMQSILNVIMNRCHKHSSSPYAECVRKLQFSSITASGDPELTLWPEENDTQWQQAQNLVTRAGDGLLNDLTGNATLYYNPHTIQSKQTIQLPTGETVAFPQKWNPASVHFVKQIGKHLFFTE